MKIEITREQYGEWRNTPVGRFVLKFLSDHRNAMINGGMEQWLNNPQGFHAVEAIARGRIHECAMVEELTYDQIIEFYKEMFPEKEEGETDGSEGSQAVSG